MCSVQLYGMTFILIIAIFACVMFILSNLSQVAKYHIKYIGYAIFCMVLSTVSGLFCLFKPGSSKNLFIPQFFLRLLRAEWWFGIDIQVSDWDNLKKADKPFVVVSNHQTSLDAVILMKTSPNGTAPLAKKILLYVPIFGQVSWLCGTIFINRKKGKTAIEIMKKVGREMKQKMTSLWIFPEGTRYQEDVIMPFKKGAFHLAIQAKVPIVPVLIGNYRNVIDRKNQIFEGGVIRVKCLPPIATEQLSVDDIDDLISKVHQLLSDAFEEDMQTHADCYKDLIPLKSH